MLLPENMAPEDSIYFNGAIVLEIVQKEGRISMADLFCELNKRKTIAFPVFLLCLDWLFLIDCVYIRNEEITLCF